MKSKNNSVANLEKKECSKLKKRRAVTEIISTMMLMGVTVSGASTLAYFMNDAFVSGTLGTATTLDSSSLNIVLLAYDTRDSSSLLTVSGVDNQYNGFLCGSGIGTTCSGNVDDIPANGGTEFIVFQIQNNNLDSIFLEDIFLNGVNYSWDPLTSLRPLSILGPLSNGDYPSDGTFSILPVGPGPTTQGENTEIQSGQIVNILLKLSSTEPDIELNKGLRILINAGGIQPVEFLLESGDAR